MSVPAGRTLEFQPTDKLMMVFRPAVPHSVIEVGINSHVPVGKQATAFVHTGAVRAKKSHTDRLQCTQIAAAK